ncbi:MAG TPA: TRAP transporter large permease [Syntrophorhabdaceae bacterium]|nr:TRAP transporter large permease [Syntrophorhabdaceae bacterium]
MHHYSEGVAIAILFSSFAAFMIIRVPIAFSLILSSIAAAVYMHLPIMALAQSMAKGVQSMALLTIPLFILAGEIMSQGGISQRMVGFANALVGRVRGGLAMVDVLACMFFGGVSGSCVADVSAIGAIMIPMMRNKGYDNDYAVGITISAAVEGVLVPPSHNMILYSIAAGTIGGGASVGALFLAGIVPGVVLAACLIISSYILAVVRKYPKGNKFSFLLLLKTFRHAFLGLLTALIILVGILSGVFTAAESSAVAVVYAFIITFFVYREAPFSQFKSVLFKTTKTLAMVMSLIATASAFGYILAQLQVPKKITDIILSLTSDKNMLLLWINILLLFLGCIMDMAPLILICTPILLPAVVAFGVHPVHFGVIMMLNLGIGLLTPPVGSALYVGCAIGDIRIDKLTRSMVPLYLTLVVVLMIVTYLPEIVAYLPRLFHFM